MIKIKTDARVRYTKKVLKNALLELLSQKPINKITVKEVCDAAELNRATFYAHYTDCFDLLSHIENELLDDFSKSLTYLDGLSVERLIAAVYDMIDNNLELCDVLIFGSSAGETLLAKMLATAHDESIRLWKSHLSKASDAELEMLFCCLANGLLHVVLEGYHRYDRKIVTDFVSATVNSCLSAYI